MNLPSMNFQRLLGAKEFTDVLDDVLFIRQMKATDVGLDDNNYIAGCLVIMEW